MLTHLRCNLSCINMADTAFSNWDKDQNLERGHTFLRSHVALRIALRLCIVKYRHHLAVPVNGSVLICKDC